MDQLANEVGAALKSYRRAARLADTAAQFWPVVQQRMADQSVTAAVAIRSVLDQAFAAIEAKYPKGVAMLKARYVQGQAIDSIAHEFGIEESGFHRQRNEQLHEIAAVISEMNRKAERRSRIERFRPAHQIFGLETAVEHLSSFVATRSNPPVLIVEGMGGLGKTTLARMLAFRLGDSEHFTDVVWLTAQHVTFDQWNGRQTVKGKPPIAVADIIRQLANGLGIAISGTVAEIQDAVRIQCQLKPYLIIFDNLETIEDMAALSPLVGQIAGLSRVIITTRDRADAALPPELQRRLFPINELSPADSYNVVRSAAAQMAIAGMAQAKDEELEPIYQLVGGNPLALWLIVGQARDRPWQVFIQDFEKDIPPGKPTYELFDYLYRRAWDLISPQSREMLFVMQRYGAGATYSQLQFLCELSNEDFEQGLSELLHRTLLIYDNEIYRIHRVTYTFLRAVIMEWWQ